MTLIHILLYCSVHGANAAGLLLLQHGYHISMVEKLVYSGCIINTTLGLRVCLLCEAFPIIHEICRSIKAAVGL